MTDPSDFHGAQRLVRVEFILYFHLLSEAIVSDYCFLSERDSPIRFAKIFALKEHFNLLCPGAIFLQ